MDFFLHLFDSCFSNRLVMKQAQNMNTHILGVWIVQNVLDLTGRLQRYILMNLLKRFLRFWREQKWNEICYQRSNLEFDMSCLGWRMKRDWNIVKHESWIKCSDHRRLHCFESILESFIIIFFFFSLLVQSNIFDHNCFGIRHIWASSFRKVIQLQAFNRFLCSWTAYCFVHNVSHWDPSSLCHWTRKLILVRHSFTFLPLIPK